MPATTLPTTQSAWLQVARGSYKADGVLKLDDQYPVPTPAEGEVVVKVKFCALNPVGHKTMAIPFMRKVRRSSSSSCQRASTTRPSSGGGEHSTSPPAPPRPSLLPRRR